MLTRIICGFTQSTPSPRPPTPAPQVARAHAPLCHCREAFSALKPHRGRWKEGPRRHPRPTPSARHTLHMWGALFSKQHHFSLHAEASNPPVGFRQVNKMLQIISLPHYSSERQNSNYNRKEKKKDFSQSSKEDVFFVSFFFFKCAVFFGGGFYEKEATVAMDARPKQRSFHPLAAVPSELGSVSCSRSEAGGVLWLQSLSKSNLYTSVEYH